MSYVTKAMVISVFTNVLLAITKVITGIMGGSGALIADGIHSFSDLTTDFFAILGNYLARKPADKEHPFGHGKIEYLTSLIIGTVVLGVGLGVIYKSTHNDVIIPNASVIVVTLITVIAKYLLASYVIMSGKKHRNNILIASGKESRTDVISSIFVLIASVLVQFSDKVDFLKYSDIVASIIVGIFIVRTGFLIVKENISVILGEQENNQEYLSKLKKIILSYDIVFSIRSMIILKFGHIVTLDLKILMDGGKSLCECHDVVDAIEEEIKKYDERVEHINIHMEPAKVKKKKRLNTANKGMNLVDKNDKKG